MYYKPYFSQRGVACKTNVLHVWFQFYSLCDVTMHMELGELSEPRFYATATKH